MPLNVVDIVGWIAAALAASIALPQFLLVVRTKQTHGLSLITWIVTAGTGLAWLGHGIKLMELPQITVNIWTYFVAWVILYFLRRNGRFRSWWVTLLGVGLGVVLILIDNLVSSSAFGVAIILPQAYGMIRQGIALMRAPQVNGVSVSSWVLQVLNQSAWLIWAILAHDPGIGISAVVSVLCALFVLVWRLLRAAGMGPIGSRKEAVASEEDAPTQGVLDTDAASQGEEGGAEADAVAPSAHGGLSDVEARRHHME